MMAFRSPLPALSLRLLYLRELAEYLRKLCSAVPKFGRRKIATLIKKFDGAVMQGSLS